MAENPFVRMYRDLAGRISRLPEVRLSRVDPEAPAEPADGWALSVGRQRVALGAVPDPPAEWTPLTLQAGFTGSAWVRVVAGRAELQGTVTRTAGDFPSGHEVLLTLPAQARPTLPAGEGLRYLPASNNTGTALAAYVGTDGDLGIRGVGETPRVDLSTIPPWSV